MLVFPRIRPQGQLGRPPAAPPSSRSLGAPPGSRKYRVQRGDSMSSILQRAGLPRSAASMLVSMNGKRSVMRASGVDFAPGHLVVGETILLPPGKAQATSFKKAAPPCPNGYSWDNGYCVKVPYGCFAQWSPPCPQGYSWHDGMCCVDGAVSGPPNSVGADPGCYGSSVPPCLPGYDWQYVADGENQCCPNGNFGTGQSDCPAGYSWNDQVGKCVEQQTADTPCPNGYYADPYTQNCVPIPSCDGGYWDPLTLQCVKTAGTVAPDCSKAATGQDGLYPEKNQDGLYTGYCIGGCGANSHFDTASQQCYCNDGYTWADATSTNCVPVSNGGGGGGGGVQPGGGGGNGGGGGDQPQPGGGGGGGGTTSSDGPGIGTVLLGLGVVAAAGYGAYALSKKSKKAQG